MKNSNSAFNNIHPSAAIAYFTVQLVLTMFISHPVFLAASFLGAVLFCAVLDGIRKALADLAFYLPMMILTAAVNPLFSHNGVTPLFFMNGNAVTLEAVLYGCDIALMLGAVVYWCKCMSAVMSSDKLLYLFGRMIPTLSLVLAMALRFIPLFKEKFNEIKAVQISIGLYDKKGAVNRLSADLKVFSSLVGWIMESGVITAGSMRSRGYGLKERSSFSVFKFTVYDAGFIILFAVFAMCTVSGAAFGAADFDFYPRITEPGFEAFDISVYTAFGACSLLPFVYELREVLRWKYSLSKI